MFHIHMASKRVILTSDKAVEIYLYKMAMSVPGCYRDMLTGSQKLRGSLRVLNLVI